MNLQTSVMSTGTGGHQALVTRAKQQPASIEADPRTSALNHWTAKHGYEIPSDLKISTDVSVKTIARAVDAGIIYSSSKSIHSK